MLLHSIAVLDKLGAHLLEEVVIDEGLRRLRSLAVSEDFRFALGTAPALRLLIDEEPGTAIRVLTDPQGRVQPRVVEGYTALLQRDVESALLYAPNSPTKTG